MAQARRKGNDGAVESDEQRGSPTMGVAVISGVTFANKSVTYYEVEGVAIVEGDIALGPVDQVRDATEAAREVVTSDPNIAFGVAIPGSQFRWPNCRIPYEIDPALPNQQRVTDAIAHWEANTAFRFPLRTVANAGQFPNYVRFTDAGGCWSRVGMQGGMQEISLGAGCGTGNAIHEIGHTVGLWHEQSREDRDLFVTINWQNIQSGMAAQFNQHITDGDDLGAYDYGSIMHYPRTAFSANGQDTITPVDPNAQIGQRNGLSQGDIGAVRAMYPACGVTPPLKKLRDERPPFKKLRDDIRPKKLRDDDLVIKSLRDPKLPRDPGPIKGALDPIVVGPGPVINPGLLQPFTMATPHHAASAEALAAAGGTPWDAETAGYAAALQRQLLELDAAIAGAHATAAQATADAARLQEVSDSVAAALQQELGGAGGAGM
jgi:hypothetical protein